MTGTIRKSLNNRYKLFKNNLFSTIGKNLATKLSHSNIDPNSHIYRITPIVCDINIDKEIFTKSFKKAVKLGKSGGPDNIFGKRLKTG